MNHFNIERAFQDKTRRGWEKLYWAIDLHDTVISGKYNRYNIGSKIYDGAPEVFHWMRGRSDMVPILYTSSHNDAIQNELEKLRHAGIWFQYINENPECPNTDLCDFSAKFYFNILLDDKAGFVGETDWYIIQHELKRLGQWNV